MNATRNIAITAIASLFSLAAFAHGEADLAPERNQVQVQSTVAPAAVKAQAVIAAKTNAVLPG